MLSEIRLQGRKLIMGAVSLFTLTLAVGVMLIFSLSLMPLVYRSAALPLVSDSLKEYTSYINLAVSAALVFVTFMAHNALKTGSDRYMLKKAENVRTGTKDIFFYFSPVNFVSLFSIKFRLLQLRLLIFTLLNVPTVLCAALLFSLSQSIFSAAVTAVLVAGLIAFFISSVYFYMRLTASLFLVKYYYIKGEYLSFRHLIASSENAMKGKEKELLRLKISFFGWFACCLFLLPMGYVWGYYNQTLAAYANKIMKLQ